MATKAVDSASIITPKSRRPTFQTSQQWHHSFPVKQQLQLTTRNLRDFGATMKTLNVAGQTPRASPSPSESSSDSESNHRIHRSTKKVCMREDMNTTREISPRPSRPTAIAIPELFDKARKEWTKPDTPAPWRASALRGAFEVVGSLPSQIPEHTMCASDFVIQMNGLSHSPLSSLSSPTSSMWKCNATTGAVTQQIGAPTRRFSRSSCGSGTGICRRSHFASPRPRSLAKPRNLSFTCKSRPSPLLSSSGMMTAGSLKADDLCNNRHNAQSTNLDSHRPIAGLSLSCKIDDSIEIKLGALVVGEVHRPSASPEPSLTAQVMCSSALRQPKTYVDHVRTKRLPQTVMHSNISKVGVRGMMEAPRHRRMSI